MSGEGKTGRLGRLATRIWRRLRRLPMQVYALTLIALISYASYRAFRYLVMSLILPAQAPAQVTQLPRKMDSRILETDRREWAGLQTVEHARTPLAHYHRLDTWIQPDRANNCTTSGCHPPLPHAERKEVRAFLNMHATSMHCGVCHMDVGGDVPGMTWYDPATGEARGAPAVLEAYGRLLTVERGERRLDDDERRRIIELLRRGAREAQDGSRLATMADHLRRTPVTAPEMLDLLAGARALMPRFFRGEYGAKLALRDPVTGRPVLAHPDVAADVERFRTRVDELDETTRQAWIERLHPLRRKQALTCSDCHARQGKVDFVSLGYPSQRIDDLTGSVVVRMVQHISEGRPFFLPEFLTPRSAPIPGEEGAPESLRP